MTPEDKPAGQSRRKMIIPIAIVLGLACAGAVYAFTTRNHVSTDDATIEAHVVTISPKVAGYVKTLPVDDNQVVKAGDVLVEVDPADYQIRVDQAQAALDAAKARYESTWHMTETTKVSAPSGLAAARAQVGAAKANWDNAVVNLKRIRGLGAAVSKRELDDAVAEEKTAHSNYDDTSAKLKSAQTAPQTVASAELNVQELAAQAKQAEAQLAQAQQDLLNTKIVAPLDGRVTARGVEQGDYVQPGQQLFSIVGTEMWVVANFKETQLKNMRVGQVAKIEVDAFPGHDIEGKVDSVQAGTGSRFSAFPAENATGNFVKIVQRVPVKIIFDQATDLPIGPGMSVVPTVYTGE